MAGRVIVLGGGVAGMTAAHELSERDFEVTVLETRDAVGGKARSFPFPGSGRDGRPPLPGEHGFRFFPGFYRHLPHTMRRIPYGSRTVADNFVAARNVQIASKDGEELLAPAHLPRDFKDLHEGFRFLFQYADRVRIAPQDTAYFIDRLLLLLTSCEERRYAEYERQSWWEFSGADSRRSKNYARYLADGLTRTLVAARAREMSARTGGYILLQLLFDMANPAGQVDRVLNGPTSDVWINPWLALLRDRGVEFRLGHQVQAIHCRDGRVTGVSVVADDRPADLEADWYVASLPVEVMAPLLGDGLALADPRLMGLHRLRTRWMNGIVYYLDRDLRGVHGHTIYIDSPWALTSISQPQFWEPQFQPDRLGDGRAHGILSVDVSDWEAIGSGVRKQAMFCSRDEIAAPAQGEPRRRCHPRPRGRRGPVLVPRPEHRSPEPDRGHQPRAATDQHGRLVERPPRGVQRPHRESLPGFRLRAHPHRPGNHGGCERGRTARRERDPRPLGLRSRAVRGVEAPRAAALRSFPRARQGALQARSPSPAADHGPRGTHRSGAPPCMGRSARSACPRPQGSNILEPTS
jgi:hypothetical protein